MGTDRLPVYMMAWNRSVQKVNSVLENIMVDGRKHCARKFPVLKCLESNFPCLISKRA